MLSLQQSSNIEILDQDVQSKGTSMARAPFERATVNMNVLTVFKLQI